MRLGHDRDSIPTTIHVDEVGEWSFGEEADIFLEQDPEGYCRAFKLELGKTDYILVRETVSGTTFSSTAEDLTAKFLAHIKTCCERDVFHAPIESATITIPVSFTPAQIKSLERAATAAGFSSVSFLLEPEAAGVAFLRDNPTQAFQKPLFSTGAEELLI